MGVTRKQRPSVRAKKRTARQHRAKDNAKQTTLVGDETVRSLMARVGVVMRNRRIELGLSQQDIAECVGYTGGHAAVSMMEGNKTRPSLGAFVAIAGALDMRPSDLLRKAEDLYTRDARQAAAVRQAAEKAAVA